MRVARQVGIEILNWSWECQTEHILQVVAVALPTCLNTVRAHLIRLIEVGQRLRSEWLGRFDKALCRIAA